MKPTNKLYRLLLISVAALLMGGCKIGKQYTRPKMELPVTLDSTSVDSTSIGDYPWEQMYTDTILQQLIQKTLDYNKDMLIAAARVKELAAMKRIDYANLFPQLGLKLYAEEEGEDYGGNNYKKTTSTISNWESHGKLTCGVTCVGQKTRAWPNL